jgi:hypothetical protein
MNTVYFLLYESEPGGELGIEETIGILQIRYRYVYLGILFFPGKE